MDSEKWLFNSDVVGLSTKVKTPGKQICAVGTSVMRAIETAVSTDGHLKEFTGWTNKFIFPPYDFSVATSMVTIFIYPILLCSWWRLFWRIWSYDGRLSTGDQEKYRFGALWRRHVDPLKMARVYISLGTNLGDRKNNMLTAVALLAERAGAILALSAL
jgi:hypothetical protein